MADFTPKSTVKSAERKLTTPLASKTVLNTIIGNILADNPWGCTPYLSGGESLPAVAKSSEYYSGKIIYENTDAKVVGSVSIKAPSSGGFDTIVSKWAELHLMTALKMAFQSPSNVMPQMVSCITSDSAVTL